METSLDKFSELYDKLKKADTQNMIREKVPNGDGIINLNALIGNYHDRAFDELNAEFVRAKQIVNDIFGVPDANFVTYDILRYFDNVDGKQDNLIELEFFRAYVNNIIQHPEVLNEFVNYLKERKQKIERDILRSPKVAKEMREKHIKELNAVMGLFEEKTK